MFFPFIDQELNHRFDFLVLLLQFFQSFINIGLYLALVIVVPVKALAIERVVFLAIFADEVILGVEFSRFVRMVHAHYNDACLLFPDCFKECFVWRFSFIFCRFAKMTGHKRAIRFETHRASCFVAAISLIRLSICQVERLLTKLAT